MRPSAQKAVPHLCPGLAPTRNAAATAQEEPQHVPLLRWPLASKRHSHPLLCAAADRDANLGPSIAT